MPELRVLRVDGKVDDVEVDVSSFTDNETPEDVIGHLCCNLIGNDLDFYRVSAGHLLAYRIWDTWDTAVKNGHASNIAGMPVFGEAVLVPRSLIKGCSD